jgi:hypothetical protein
MGGLLLKELCLASVELLDAAGLADLYLLASFLGTGDCILCGCTCNSGAAADIVGAAGRGR